MYFSSNWLHQSMTVFCDKTTCHARFISIFPSVPCQFSILVVSNPKAKLSMTIVLISLQLTKAGQIALTQKPWTLEWNSLIPGKVTNVRKPYKIGLSSWLYTVLLLLLIGCARRCNYFRYIYTLHQKHLCEFASERKLTWF